MIGLAKEVEEWEGIVAQQPEVIIAYCGETSNGEEVNIDRRVIDDRYVYDMFVLHELDDDELGFSFREHDPKKEEFFNLVDARNYHQTLVSNREETE